LSELIGLALGAAVVWGWYELGLRRRRVDHWKAFLADVKAARTVSRWNGYVEEHDEGD
jgi:hypothetical protein